jgi:hypothetical protein
MPRINKLMLSMPLLLVAVELQERQRLLLLPKKFLPIAVLLVIRLLAALATALPLLQLARLLQ